jgi:purine-binding chemotaxis protein CheW
MAEPTDQGQTAFEELYRRLDQAERALIRDNAATPEERRKVLASRAQALSGARVQSKIASSLEVLAFRVGGERYAVHIGEVDEVLDIKGLYPLLGAPRQVLGAMLARSRVLPVLDLRQLLGLEGGGLSDLTKVVALAAGEELFGLAVEEIEGKLALERVTDASPATGPFLYVAPDRLAVLDLAQLASPGAPRNR